MTGASHHAVEEQVKPDARDTVKKELILDAVSIAEGIEADEDAVMHEIGHLAEDTEREPEEIAETMRQNGTYVLLQEELARQKALDFLAENAVAVEMPEEEEEAEEEAVLEDEGNEEEEAVVEVGPPRHRRTKEKRENELLRSPGCNPLRYRAEPARRAGDGHLLAAVEGPDHLPGHAGR